MITRHVLMLSTAVVLTAMAAGPASSQTSPAALQATTPRGKFLAPLASRFVVTPTDSERCKKMQQGRRCPPVLLYGGPAPGGVLPTTEPALKAYLPNIRVSFVLQEIENRIVDNGGVNTDSLTWVEWTTTSAAAALENGGPYDYPLPAPGITWDEDELYHTLIYDALVFNACESFASFPVQHDAVIETSGIETGAFHGVDNSTLDHTGFYNFSYTARASGANGKVSDFRFSGKVNVTCSGLNALP
jgi:hypothetical protein